MIYNPRHETMKRDELEQLQIERLQSTLNRVYRNVAFYRHTFDAHGVDIGRIRSIAALQQLPFTTRDDLARSYPYDLFAVPLRDIVRIHSTPGTTTTPLAVGYTANDLRHWTESTARLLAAAGITANDVVQIAFPYGLFLGGFGFHQGAELVNASVIPSLATASVEKQVTIIRDYKTTTLICTPSYALHVAHALADLQIHPERLHLRVGIFGGEPWSDALRAELEERLRLTALDTYGLSEVLGPGVAGECPERQGLHINEDHFIVEVINPRTLSPVPAGAPGELVFTTITREGVPVIRYRTGDLSAITTAPCRCGRTFARMTKVTARTDDRFFFGGVGIFPRQIEEVLRSVEGASPHYQIILDRVNGQDTMELRLEVSEDVPSLDEIRQLERLRDRIVQRIETVLDVRARITLVEPTTVRSAGEARVIDRREPTPIRP